MRSSLAMLSLTLATGAMSSLIRHSADEHSLATLLGVEADTFDGPDLKASLDPSPDPDAPMSTPEADVSGPDFPSETPEFPTETPEVAITPPEFPSETPEFPTETPEVATETPEVAITGPEFPSETHEFPTEAPEVATETPEVAITGPGFPTVAPELDSSSDTYRTSGRHVWSPPYPTEPPAPPYSATPEGNVYPPPSWGTSIVRQVELAGSVTATPEVEMDTDELASPEPGDADSTPEMEMEETADPADMDFAVATSEAEMDREFDAAESTEPEFASATPEMEMEMGTDFGVVETAEPDPTESTEVMPEGSLDAVETKSTQNPSQEEGERSTVASPEADSREARPKLSLEDDDANCFPAHATVELDDGSVIRMSELSVGDSVKAGVNEFSRVFMFTHRMDDSFDKNKFVVLQTADNRKLELTAGHFLYVNANLVPAGEVAVGDMLRLGDGTESVVASVSKGQLGGLYNPQTVSGDIVVNGITASTYTTAVEPRFAHAILAPFRALSRSFGFEMTALETGGGVLTGFAPRSQASL